MRSLPIILLFLSQINIFSQSTLRVTLNRFGTTRVYHVNTSERLEYRLKGECKFKKRRISEMQDSIISFNDFAEARLDEIGGIRIRNGSHLAGTFQKAFLIAGVGLFAINTVNTFRYNQGILDISLALIGVGLLIRETGIRRIKINKHNHLKIISTNYEHLSNQ